MNAGIHWEKSQGFAEWGQGTVSHGNQMAVAVGQLVLPKGYCGNLSEVQIAAGSWTTVEKIHVGGQMSLAKISFES